MMSPASGFGREEKDHVGSLLVSERGAGILMKPGVSTTVIGTDNTSTNIRY
jgi:hypothetical protein